LVPRRRDVVQVAALGAAVIIALQLTMTHWFYLYVVWFAPLALVAVMARWRTGPEPEDGDPGDAQGRVQRRAVTA
ncbi:MAG: hypothetical protein ACR2J6_06475, partial [Thermoleophilaceae bacterium]